MVQFFTKQHHNSREITISYSPIIIIITHNNETDQYPVMSTDQGAVGNTSRSLLIIECRRMSCCWLGHFGKYLSAQYGREICGK